MRAGTDGLAEVAVGHRCERPGCAGGAHRRRGDRGCLPRRALALRLPHGRPSGGAGGAAPQGRAAAARQGRLHRRDRRLRRRGLCQRAARPGRRHRSGHEQQRHRPAGGRTAPARRACPSHGQRALPVAVDGPRRTHRAGRQSVPRGRCAGHPQGQPAGRAGCGHGVHAAADRRRGLAAAGRSPTSSPASPRPPA